MESEPVFVELWHILLGAIGFVGLVLAIWAKITAAKKSYDDKVASLIKERINMGRDIADLNKRLDNHEERDDRIYTRLDSIDKRLGGIDLKLAVNEAIDHHHDHGS